MSVDNGLTAPVRSPVHSAETSREQWRQLSGAGQLFAILDACDEPVVPAKCRELGPTRAVSLYSAGEVTEAPGPEPAKKGPAMRRDPYAGFAPYLVQVDQQTFDWISGTLQGRPWGIFAYSAAALGPLRIHFQRFIHVRGEKKKLYFFRFYDPRVLPVFLQNCTAGEAGEFFGPVRGYGVESGAGVSLLRRKQESGGA